MENAIERIKKHPLSAEDIEKLIGYGDIYVSYHKIKLSAWVISPDKPEPEVLEPKRALSLTRAKNWHVLFYNRPGYFDDRILSSDSLFQLLQNISKVADLNAVLVVELIEFGQEEYGAAVMKRMNHPESFSANWRSRYAPCIYDGLGFRDNKTLILNREATELFGLKGYADANVAMATLAHLCSKITYFSFQEDNFDFEGDEGRNTYGISSVNEDVSIYSFGEEEFPIKDMQTLLDMPGYDAEEAIRISRFLPVSDAYPTASKIWDIGEKTLCRREFWGEFTEFMCLDAELDRKRNVFELSPYEKEAYSRLGLFRKIDSYAGSGRNDWDNIVREVLAELDGKASRQTQESRSPFEQGNIRFRVEQLSFPSFRPRISDVEKEVLREQNLAEGIVRLSGHKEKDLDLALVAIDGEIFDEPGEKDGGYVIACLVLLGLIPTDTYVFVIDPRYLYIGEIEAVRDMVSRGVFSAIFDPRGAFGQPYGAEIEEFLVKTPEGMVRLPEHLPEGYRLISQVDDDVLRNMFLTCSFLASAKLDKGKDVEITRWALSALSRGYLDFPDGFDEDTLVLTARSYDVSFRDALSEYRADEFSDWVEFGRRLERWFGLWWRLVKWAPLALEDYGEKLIDTLADTTHIDDFAEAYAAGVLLEDLTSHLPE